MARAASRLLSKVTGTPPALAGLPKLADVEPAYAETIAKTIKVREELAAVTKEMVTLPKQPQGAGVDRAAAMAVHARQQSLRRVLGADGPAETAPPSTDGDRIVALRARRDELAQAGEYLDEQARRLRAEASRKLCDQIEPRYEEIVGDIANRLLDLAKAYSTYTALAHALTTDGVVWGSLNPMPLAFLEDGPRSDGAQALRDAAKRGLISANDIPDAFRFK